MVKNDCIAMKMNAVNVELSNNIAQGMHALCKKKKKKLHYLMYFHFTCYLNNLKTFMKTPSCYCSLTAPCGCHSMGRQNHDTASISVSGFLQANSVCTAFELVQSFLIFTKRLIIAKNATALFRLIF